MRYMKVRVWAGYVVDMYTQDSVYNIKCIRGLPEGTKFVYSIPDMMYGIWLVVEHESFECLKDGDLIPEFEDIQLEQI